jgi:NAD(P)-dependent dehydrogenase (short-subunit alcohol dehydrogenase family)
MPDLPRSVLITGASTGIGRATALHLDSQGFQVFAGVRKKSDFDRLAHEGSANLSPIFIDVTDEDSRKAAAATVVQAVNGHGLQGMVNNAGTFVGGPLEYLPLEDLRRQFEINVFGQVAVTQTFLPLIRRGRGRVVLLGSTSGRLATPLLGPYAASKFAIEALADSMRLELAQWSIPVALVAPGNVATPMWEKTLARVQDLLDAFPQEAADLYRPMIEATVARGKQRGEAGIPPETVARAIEHALTSPRPKIRYLVGMDAKIQALLVWLAPDRLLDYLIWKSMGLKRYE